jgi:hypothetical protein
MAFQPDAFFSALHFISDPLINLNKFKSFVDAKVRFQIPHPGLRNLVALQSRGLRL